MRSFALTGLLALLLAGCLHAPAVTDQASPAAVNTPITDQRWLLVSVRGSTARLGTTVQVPWLELLSDGRILGYTGCNRLQGSYSLAGDALTFPPLAMTRKACMANRELERGFTDGLGDSRRYRLDNGQLVLFKGNEEVLRFDPAPAPSGSDNE